jgi:hypothetical protein
MYALQLFSQVGEDGIIENILDCIGTTSRYYVEFGVQVSMGCPMLYTSLTL